MQEVFEKIIRRIEVAVKSSDNSNFTNGLLSAQDIIKQEAAEYNNGWIPCSERLPEENSNVFACFAHGLVTVLTFYGGLFHGIYEYTTRVIIAWQHLPAPYQPSVDHKKKTNFDMCCESMETMAKIIDIAKIGWTKEQIMEWLQSEAEG